MSANITSITAAISDSGVLRNNLYVVKIEFPHILQSSFGTKSEALMPRIDRVTLPPRQIRGVMQKSSYRELRMIPTSYQNLDDLSMSILLSADMRERKMMLAWQNTIFNKDGIPSYIDNVSGTITVKTLGSVNGREPDKGDSSIHTFENVFPMMVSDIELAAADEEAGRITVIFQYRIWTSEGSQFTDRGGF